MIRGVLASLRLSVSLFAVSACIFLCLGFWLSTSKWDPVVFGRYTVKWFVGSIGVSAILLWLTWAVLKALWQKRRPAPTSAIGKPLVGRVLPVLCAVAVTLSGVEVVLRYVDYPPKDAGPSGVREFSQEYHAFLQQVERTKRDGKLVRSFRGRIYEEKKPGVFRIVCLGGSTTWGHHLEPQETWPGALEELLRNRSYDVEVINAARPWYTTAHSLVNYSLYLRHLDPDLVIVTHGINDLARSLPRHGEPGVELDYGSYRGPMERVLRAYESRAGPDLHKLAELIQSSALYRLVCRYTAVGRRFFGDFRRSAIAAPTDDNALTDAAFPTIETFRSNLAYLVRLCLADGRRVVLGNDAHAYLCLDESQRAESEHVRAGSNLNDADGRPISGPCARAALEGVHDATLAVADEMNVPVVDLCEVVGGRVDHFFNAAHLTAKGAAVAADAFAEVVGPILDAAFQSESLVLTSRKGDCAGQSN